MEPHYNITSASNNGNTSVQLKKLHFSPRHPRGKTKKMKKETVRNCQKKKTKTVRSKKAKKSVELKTNLVIEFTWKVLTTRATTLSRIYISDPQTPPNSPLFWGKKI